VAVGFLVSPAFADYTGIQHNLFDGTYDTTYIDGTLSVSGDSDLVTLNDPTPLGGAITLAHVELETYFHHVEEPTPGDVKAVFWGGAYQLTFNYDGTPHHIGGPILAMDFRFNDLAGGTDTIDGEGLFTAAYDLPGSGIWDDEGGYSSIDTLTLTFDAGTDWSWAQDILEAETTYSIAPNDGAAPEPTAIALLALGGLIMARRRR
jgi:hypothetical protein